MSNIALRIFFGNFHLDQCNFHFLSSGNKPRASNLRTSIFSTCLVILVIGNSFPCSERTQSTVKPMRLAPKTSVRSWSPITSTLPCFFPKRLSALLKPQGIGLAAQLTASTCAAALIFCSLQPPLFDSSTTSIPLSRTEPQPLQKPQPSGSVSSRGNNVLSTSKITLSTRCVGASQHGITAILSKRKSGQNIFSITRLSPSGRSPQSVFPHLGY